MPHPIFDIDELLRLVIDELVETSRGSAVSFALTCRSLEEPTLSSLWKKQPSFLCLLMVLPGCVSLKDGYGHSYVVSGCFPFLHALSNTNSPRKLDAILQGQTGPGSNDTPPGCVD
jgi:hypothetical protein